MNTIYKLHSVDDNSVILININNIICIDTDEYDKKRCSTVYLTYSDEINAKMFTVNETPEKIYEALRKYDINLIKLHNTDYNSVIYVNTALIKYIETLNYLSTVFMVNLKPFTVNETPEKIEHIINNIKK